MSGPGKVHFLRPGFTVNGRTTPAGTWCGRTRPGTGAGRASSDVRAVPSIAGPAGYRRAGKLNGKRWRPATGRNPPIEAWSQPTPWGHASRVPASFAGAAPDDGQSGHGAGGGLPGHENGRLKRAVADLTLDKLILEGEKVRGEHQGREG